MLIETSAIQGNCSNFLFLCVSQIVKTKNTAIRLQLSQPPRVIGLRSAGGWVGNEDHEFTTPRHEHCVPMSLWSDERVCKNIQFPQYPFKVSEALEHTNLTHEEKFTERRLLNWLEEHTSLKPDFW